VRRIATGAGLILAGRGFAVVAQFGALLVLARLLDEQEFGLAWMVAVVTSVFGVATDLGMEVVAVQREDVDEWRAANLSWYGGGAALAAVFLLAPLFARAFGEPAGLVDLLRAGSAGLLFAGVGAPARARLRRDFRFGRLAVTDAARAAAAVVASVTLALLGFGAWAIVLGDVFAGGIAAAAAWLLAPAMRRGRDRALAVDGVRVVGTRAADMGFAQADRFFVGARLGAGALGLYGFAWRHAMLLVQQLLPVADQVALPWFSRLQGDRAALQAAYLKLTRALAWTIVPGAALLYALAPWLVGLLYPDRWQEAVPAMRALCVAAAAAGLNSDPGILWLALGRTRLRLTWSLANLVVVVPIVAVGTRWGIPGVGYALAARSLVATVVAQAITRRVAGIPHRAYVRALFGF